MFRKLFLVTIALNFFCSCTQLDQQEAIPSYVHIPSLKLQASPDQGSSFHQFKDVWVYANNEYVGAYEMPVRFQLSQKEILKLKSMPDSEKMEWSLNRLDILFWIPM